MMEENDYILEGIEKKALLRMYWQMFKDLYEIRNESHAYEMDRDQINDLIYIIKTLKIGTVSGIKICEKTGNNNGNSFFREKLKNPDFFTDVKGEVTSIILEEIRLFTPETMEMGITRDIMVEEAQKGEIPEEEENYE